MDSLSIDIDIKNLFSLAVVVAVAATEIVRKEDEAVCVRHHPSSPPLCVRVPPTSHLAAYSHIPSLSGYLAWHLMISAPLKFGTQIRGCHRSRRVSGGGEHVIEGSGEVRWFCMEGGDGVR